MDIPSGTTTRNVLMVKRYQAKEKSFNHIEYTEVDKPYTDRRIR
jgi:hypothetical protein